MGKWIRSKYESVTSQRWNSPINISNLDSIQTDTQEGWHVIRFKRDSYTSMWQYVEKEQRDQEYEWVMNQMDTKTNEG